MCKISPKVKNENKRKNPSNSILFLVTASFLIVCNNTEKNNNDLLLAGVEGLAQT